ncbi:MAG: glycosyltransferase family 2 protein [Proteobacteria bacterium]|nr:MAG: glycosyltransferase family 2 protein [Pseudomonadota bacterium]QKK12065.1 MAG: glycosyltransferase family 2 protein [Pseudomonadota bacterium]
MKVSVVIPTYNRADMVVGAIDSVLTQSMGSLEIIVVDDGSTDNTTRALLPYRNRINYIYTKNQGPASARNRGMLAAKGEYIAYLDSDDIYRPFKLALQCGLLDQHPDVGMVYTEFSGFDDDGYYDEWHLRHYHASAYSRGGITYEKIFNESVPLIDTEYGRKALAGSDSDWLNRRAWFGPLYDQYLFNTLVFTNSMVFRRSLLESVGLQEPKFGMFHDLEFALRLCREATAAFIDAPTYLLRYHPGQISGTHSHDFARLMINKQRDLLRVFRAHTRSSSKATAIDPSRTEQQIARLCRAVAMPLLAYDQGGSHENRYYPRRARRYLQACTRAGYSERALWALSFMPHIVRRAGFKLMRMTAAARQHRTLSPMK